jgi:branched-chain amino acid transport system permease protein
MSISSTEQGTSTSAAQLNDAEPPRLLGTPSRWLTLAVILTAIVAFFLIASEDWLTIVNYMLIAAIAALALNVLSGYTGQVSLGIAFFMAIGASTAAWLGGDPPTSPRDPLGLGLSFLIWLPASGITAALAGAIIGPSALRLKGFYLGIVSLALIFIGHYLFINASYLTGGPQGRTFPVPTIGNFSFAEQNTLFGMQITSGQQFFLLLLLILALSSLFVGNVMRSQTGRAFQAVRDNEMGAAIMGINLFEAKMGAFILSSFLAGIAGALFASYSRYVIPNYWDLALSIQFVAAIIVGGVASVWGSILGAAFVFALPRLIDQFSLLPPNTGSGGISSGDLNALIYGLLIIIFLLFEPEGVIGLIHRRRIFTRKSNIQKEGGELAETIDLPSLSNNEPSNGNRVNHEEE